MLAPVKVVCEEERGFRLFLPCINHKELVHRAMEAGQSIVIDIPDPRRVSREQQMKAHVLIGYIAEWYGGTPTETMKVILKEMFRGQVPSILEEEFSLSDCSMECARLFISWLIDFCLLYNIPTGVPMYELAEDIPKYVWACLMNKRCCCCGKPADLHHCEGGRIGMGGNRDKVRHLGRPALALCREHHTEIHKIGETDFCKRYFLMPVKIDRRIAEVYGLNKGENPNE